ncbi:hypothetical protein ACEK07_04665 [Alcanivoracaceae bacterium MT1]
MKVLVFWVLFLFSRDAMASRYCDGLMVLHSDQVQAVEFDPEHRNDAFEGNVTFKIDDGEIYSDGESTYWIHIADPVSDEKGDADLTLILTAFTYGSSVTIDCETKHPSQTLPNQNNNSASSILMRH